mgnify:CR=1 FL=1
MVAATSCGRADSDRDATASNLMEPLQVTYRDGLEVDVYHPEEDMMLRDVVVVMVHGCCGDRRDLRPLAEAIAGRGATVVNADVRALGDGGGWPQTYLDVSCLIGWADIEIRQELDDARLVVVAWSDGALVASTVALGWQTFADAAVGDGCPGPLPSTGADVIVGISGHYGWTGAVPDHLDTDRAAEWFGGTAESGAIGWTHGNPGWWVVNDEVVRTTNFVLLGTIDDRNTEWFGDRLVEHAIPVELTLLERGSHDALILPHGNMGTRALGLIEEVLARG